MTQLSKMAIAAGSALTAWWLLTRSPGTDVKSGKPKPSILAWLLYSKIKGFSGAGVPKDGEVGTEPARHPTLSVYSGDKHWTADGTQVHPIRAASKGIASTDAATGTVPQTMPGLLAAACKVHGDKKALVVERPMRSRAELLTKKPTYVSWTYQEYYDECKQVAKSFIKLGVQQFGTVNIIGFNSPEWFIADVAAVMCGAKAAGIYTTNAPDACQYISEHSDASVVVCEDQGQLDKFLQVLAGGALPKLKTIVVWGAFEKPDVAPKGVTIYSWAELKKLGADVPEAELGARMDAIEPGHCCQLIYTSGTTGKPKAVMICHDNVIFESNVVLSMIGGNLGSGEQRIISYLPLSHVAGLMVDIITPTLLTANLAFGDQYCTTMFARPDALKGTLPVCLQAAKPTLFLGVPRVWEKVCEGVKAKGKLTKGAAKKVAMWAKARGLEAAMDAQVDGYGCLPWGHGLAKALVFKKVKAALGLSDCRFAMTGAAPITADTLGFFGALGIQVNEVYGMSECTGATTWSVSSKHKWGSCGFPMPGTELKLADCGYGEGQGEICYRGRHIMMGYMANQSLGATHVAEIEKKNADAIDSEGWLHSGDVGRLTDGMLNITGRIKELIIGAGGENIAPVPIEDEIKRNCPALSNVMIVGDKRKYNTALVTLKTKPDADAQPTDNLDAEALELESGTTTVTAALKSQAVFEAVKAAIVAYNKGATCVANVQKVQYFRILPKDFTEKAGDLTATLKLKRPIVTKKYADLIESMYSSDQKVALGKPE